ncbi:hypothetical protein [Aquimarina longa]|uniref:hypothetical protein n=1 Tax=Aquimarina longa TaxID=1080221 RepID=UPI000784C8A5|nr:hypothetical protein [Aquimarina longa]
MKIKNKKGQDVIITDLKEALREAKIYVRWHDETKLKKELGALEDGVIYFENAHSEWEHNLEQLKELANQILYKELTSKGWEQTDPSCNQYRKKIEDNIYLFREDRIINPHTEEIEVYESKINLSNYTQMQMFEEVKQFGYSFNEMCNWIDEGINPCLIAKCIFEMEVS